MSPSPRQSTRNCRANDASAAFHERFPLEQATVIEAEAGDVIFFHYCTVHGSMSNESPEPRKAVHVRMFSGRDCKENAEQPFENLVLRGWNYHANVKTTASTSE